MSIHTADSPGGVDTVSNSPTRTERAIVTHPEHRRASTTDVLRALADETRLRIVSVLDQVDALCACDIEAVLDINQSNASRHLAKLRSAGIISAVREGHWVHYALARSSSHAELLFRTLESVREEREPFQADLDRLRDYQPIRFTCKTERADRG